MFSEQSPKSTQKDVFALRREIYAVYFKMALTKVNNKSKIS
jgi:hypothetical protein